MSAEDCVRWELEQSLMPQVQYTLVQQGLEDYQEIQEIIKKLEGAVDQGDVEGFWKWLEILEQATPHAVWVERDMVEFAYQGM
jgi:hypothetical protein